MKPLLKLLAAVVLFNNSAVAQLTNIPARETAIPVTDHLDTSYNEFSGLARWNDKLLLVVQHAESFGSQLYAIDLSSVDSVIDGMAPAVSHFYPVHLNGLQKIVNAIDPAHKYYGGFEAAVAVGNSLYLTVEMDTDTCYILRGHLRQLGNDIFVDLLKKYPIVKPHPNIANAGFESIAYLRGKGKLVTFFENNYLHGHPTVLAVDTGLTRTEIYHFTDPPLMRITDANALNDSEIMAINHYYNDYHSKQRKEYNYYVKDDLAKAMGQIHGMNPMDSSFTSVILMRLKGKQIEWKEKKFISFSTDNWEGLLPYREGVLMVIDGVPPGKRCRLAYFRL